MSKAIAKQPAHAPARISEDRAADLYTAGYQKAVGGTRDLLVFGAMHQWLGAVLEKVGGNPTLKKGEGLKGWIEAKCPKVNYKTAYKWHKLAVEIGETLKIPKGTDLYRLLTAPLHELDRKDLGIRKEIDDAIEGKSAHQLEIFTGIRKETRLIGAPAGNQNAKKDLADDPASQLEAAKLRVSVDCGKAVTKLGKLIGNKSISFLGLPGIRVLAEELERLAADARAVLKETADSRH